MARLGRGRRIKATVLRGRSVTTPTPLVRKRVVVELDRRPWLLGLGRQRRIKAKILRAPRNAPTATPLVRKRLVLSPNASERSRFRATWLKPRPRKILRPPAPPIAAPSQRPRKPLVVMSRRASLKARFLRDKPRIARAPGWPQRPRPVVSESSRRPRTRRPRPRILRAPLWAPRARPAVVARTTRARAKTRRPGATVVRPSSTTQPILVRHTPIVSRQRRDRVVRAYYQRHRAHFETSTLGSAPSAPLVVVGQFDTPEPSGPGDAGGIAAQFFGGGEPSGGADGGAGTAGSFDAAQPGVIST